MKPSDAELNELLLSAHWIDLAEDSHGVELSMRQTKTAMQLAKAELQRRQQPASVPAELSDDLLWKWFKESLKRRGLLHFDFFVLRDVAREAAAYGREQALKEAAIGATMGGKA